MPIVIVLVAFVLVFALARNASASASSSGMPLAPSDAIARFANAIAIAEGYPVAGSVADRAHNPGNLKNGEPSINGVTIYSTPADGWSALFHQLVLIRDGRSSRYNPQMSIADMADIYTGADDPSDWTTNVATVLGVAPTTPIGSLL